MTALQSHVDTGPSLFCSPVLSTSVWVSGSCYNKWLQTQELKTAQIYWLCSSGGQDFKISLDYEQVVGVPLGCTKGNSVSLPFARKGCLHSLAHGPLLYPSKPAASSLLSHLSAFLLFPTSPIKDSCDYLGLAWVIHDNLSTWRSLDQ